MVFIYTCVIRESLRDSAGEYIAMIRYRTVHDRTMNASRDDHVREYREYCVIHGFASSSANREIDVLETYVSRLPEIAATLHVATMLQQPLCNFVPQVVIV